jgi:hypothetical protein
MDGFCISYHIDSTLLCKGREDFKGSLPYSYSNFKTAILLFQTTAFLNFLFTLFQLQHSTCIKLFLFYYFFMPNEQERLPRWQFRKQKKLEKRRKKRKEIAESREVPKEIENQRGEEYEQQKAQWEANEVKHKVIELARLKAIEKEKESRKIAQVESKSCTCNF